MQAPRLPRPNTHSQYGSRSGISWSENTRRDLIDSRATLLMGKSHEYAAGSFKNEHWRGERPRARVASRSSLLGRRRENRRSRYQDGEHERSHGYDHRVPENRGRG